MCRGNILFSFKKSLQVLSCKNLYDFEKQSEGTTQIYAVEVCKICGQTAEQTNKGLTPGQAGSKNKNLSKIVQLHFMPFIGLGVSQVLTISRLKYKQAGVL